MTDDGQREQLDNFSDDVGEDASDCDQGDARQHELIPVRMLEGEMVHER